MFWFCDYRSNGYGLLLRHMMCGSQRIFNSEANECVLLGQIKHQIESNLQEISKALTTLMEDEKFTCSGKATGKYPDSRNCQQYHFCLPTSFAPLNELLFACPDGLAYDPHDEQCTIDAIGKCVQPHFKMQYHLQMSESN